MPQTKNFGFPLIADTPPEGATGKDLRNMTVGEGDGSLASMVDDELQKVKNSVLPVYQKGITLTWDGNTTNLTAAGGKLSFKFATISGTESFYKISDEIITSDFKNGNDITQKAVRFGDNVYGFGFANSWSAFCALSAGASVTISDSLTTGTLTFPQSGFYVGKYSHNGAYTEKVIVSERRTAYDPDTMGSLAAETTNNRVQVINGNSTHDKYPTAKAVWNALANAGGSGGISGVKVNGAALEAENGEVDITVPTKTSELENDSGFVTGAALAGKEDVSNKLQTYTGTEGSWSDATSTNYPSAAAVRDFVASYVGKHAATFGDFAELYEMFIHPEMNTVELDAVTWDGNTEGVPDFLGVMYKIGEYTEFPDKFKAELSLKESDGTVSGPIDAFESGFPYFFTNSKTTDLKEAFGIVVYSLDRGGNDVQPLIVVSDRSGTLPAAVIEQMMGTNPGMDVPYESGVYVLYNGEMFVSKAVSYITVKNYIDKRLEDLITNNGQGA